MARKYRYFVPFGYFHVYVRVARGEMIFDDPLLSEHWMQTAKKVAADFELRILAWCLMTLRLSMVHLFVRSTREPASESSLNGWSKHATFRLGSWRVTFEQPS